MESTVVHAQELFRENSSLLSVRERIWQEVTHAVNAISRTERSVEVQKRCGMSTAGSSTGPRTCGRRWQRPVCPRDRPPRWRRLWCTPGTFNDVAIKRRLGRLVGPPTSHCLPEHADPEVQDTARKNSRQPQHHQPQPVPIPPCTLGPLQSPTGPCRACPSQCPCPQYDNVKQLQVLSDSVLAILGGQSALVTVVMAIVTAV
ncbi:hypothetical protein SKAU_G00002770 [Synaphobranchus kaupii]|uniref:Uncharacterized protein n=1 Tax=Synaphobranchus kaupii TaxID=118154 RepID=A0A9Q1JCQ9_SYNKA|nr:hypothetical protein SKAU_G00002770 [Synaphobranchus kaupii]